jgi:hypothetical protein
MRPSSSISIPSPTMTRNDQNTTGTGGQFSRGTLSRPFIGAFRSCLRISDDSFGTEIA